MRSLLRIAVGVLVGVSVLAGLAYLAERFPVAARFVFMVLDKVDWLQPDRGFNLQTGIGRTSRT